MAPRRSRVAQPPVFSAGEVSREQEPQPVRLPAAALLFQAPDLTALTPARRPRALPAEAEEKEAAPDTEEPKAGGAASRRRRGGRGRRRSTGDENAAPEAEDLAGPDAPALSEEIAEQAEASEEEGSTSRRRRRRRTSAGAERPRNEVSAVEGSTRLEAKRQRRREGREAGRRRHVITESEFLARRESVDRIMLVREQDGLNQIAVLEDEVLVEHYVARHTQTSMVGNVYLGRVQNVLPSMEAAFVDVGKGRNAVLYAGEVNWDAAGMEGQPRRIEQALRSGDTVLVQVTKDPIGQKGARLTSQITLAGRHLVLVPSGAMTGISRKLPERERARLKKLLKEIVPESAGVIVRTAAEGATEEQLRDDVARLVRAWEDIQKKAASAKSAPVLLKGEPELALRVVRDVFNEDFSRLIVAGGSTWRNVSSYVQELSPDLADRLTQWVEPRDLFAAYRVDEQLAKGLDRKVWLPSGGSLIIDRTEAMTVIDVNTGRFTGSGGSLEETVTRNNLEAAEEIVRQLRLRDIGGIIVVDFIDMVLESNRDLVLRRLVECLGRDRTRHQVAEVTSLGLVQMTRKRVGQGLVEAFSDVCEHCGGRGLVVHAHPVEKSEADTSGEGSRKRRGRGRQEPEAPPTPARVEEPRRDEVRATLATIAAAAASAHEAVAPETLTHDDAAHATSEVAAAAVHEPVAEPAVAQPLTAETAETAEVAESAPAAAEPTEDGAAPATEAAGTSRRRGGRRRVVATGAPTAASDLASAIIALPAPRESAEVPATLLPVSTLESLVFPEHKAPAAPRKKPRRATSAAQAPDSPPQAEPAAGAPEVPEGD